MPVATPGCPTRKPAWLDKKIRLSDCVEVEQVLGGLRIHTVCSQAACPNIGECFARKQATIIILGTTCTRTCSFCNVEKGVPAAPDSDEARRTAEAVKRLGLRHAVITSVTRDDLGDGGAEHFAAVIRAVRSGAPETAVEVLIPDFQGRRESLAAVVAARPAIIAHNVETVPRLYARARSQADYRRSLDVLSASKELDSSVPTKSGLMLGLGETSEEVFAVMRDLRDRDVDFLSIGQYLAPSERHLPVAEYVAPQSFRLFQEYAVKLGFRHAACAPYVRSSYHAEDYLSGMGGVR